MNPSKAPEGDGNPLLAWMQPRKLRCVRCGRKLRGRQTLLCNFVDCRTARSVHGQPTSYKLR